ncbi:MAG: putative sulfate exporter family transporter [Spirochaetota bacterium]
MIPGLALSLALACLAWFLGFSMPIVGAPIVGILLGMGVAFWKRPPTFEAGIRAAGKTGLKAAIILLGFGMNLGNVARAGVDSLLVLCFTLLAAFLTALLASRLLGLRGNQPILIAFGTAICGGSAIAAVAPIVEASDEEVAHAISTIFLFNVLAVFLFPALGHLIGLGDRGFGLWAGTAINDTSSVVAAAYSWSDSAGAYATVVKLTRTLFIIPLTLGLALLRNRGFAGAGSGFHAGKVFPWFVVGFLASSLARTLGLIPDSLSDSLAVGGKFLIVVAMAAIGLNTDLVKLLRNGRKPIVLGLACWAAVALTSLAAQGLTGTW